MKLRYKILILAIVLTGGIVFVGSKFEPVKAATRKIITTLSGKNTTKSVANNNGLVGAWDFDDCDTCTTAKDRSGNNNNGTMYNDGGSTQADLHGVGRVGKGVTLDGSDDYVDNTYSSVFDFGTGNFSFSAWIKRTGAGVGGEHVLGRYGAASQPRWGLKTSGADVQVFIVDSDGVGLDYSSGFTPVTDQWYHLTGVVDRTNNISRIFVNGTQVATKDISSFTGTFSSASGAVQIGAVSGNYFKGSIDEARVYNRALSAVEIKNLYASTQKSFVNMPQNRLLNDGLVGLWSFNGQDMSGVTATDKGSGGNNGTLTNGPTAIPGIVGQALNFDGSNDYVTIADHATLDLTGSVSMAVWVKHTSSTFKDWEAIFTKGDSAYRLHLCGNITFCGGSPTDDAFSVAITGTGCSNNGTTSTVVPALNRWYHVVATYDGSAAKIYIDGVLDAETACTGSISTNAHALYIGENAESTGRQWTGEIDEARLYNRALSAAEVSVLYRAGKR
ncbi:MAG: LamG domain-containing protein [Patescibacteria group bacterium]